MLKAADVQLTVMARTDPGTGLPNRRTWEEALPAEIARAHRRPHPIGVVLVDLDHLKAFNDTHGHAAGDTLLARADAALYLAKRTGRSQTVPV